MPETSAEWLARQRWFASKDQPVSELRILDRIAIPHTTAHLEILEVVRGSEAEQYVIVRTEDDLDAVGQPEVASALLRCAYETARLPSENGGMLAFWNGEVLHELPLSRVGTGRRLGVEQSNTSIAYGQALLFKLIRRIRTGIHPEIEIGQFLTERTPFSNMAGLAATVSYRSPEGEIYALGLFQTWVPSVADAWTTSLRRLDSLLSHGQAGANPAARLGEVTGQLHLALASGSLPAFAPEVVTPELVADWKREIRQETSRAFAAVGQPSDVPAHIEEALSGLDGLVGTLRIRIHGDLHLGQVLEAPDGDFAIIDFEGEPTRPLSARRSKQPPLRDVAGMLRSCDYARHAALRELSPSFKLHELQAADWLADSRQAFVRSYVRTVHGSNARLLPSQEALGPALRAFEIQKAAYEVLYEASHRPDWVGIPLAALSS
jgi:trehalose synthase-fused probable maltokinase